MLGLQKRFNIWFAIGPFFAASFGAGVAIMLAFPSLGWLGAWLALVPALLIGAALVLGVVANVIGHFLR